MYVCHKLRGRLKKDLKPEFQTLIEFCICLQKKATDAAQLEDAVRIGHDIASTRIAIWIRSAQSMK